MESPLHTHIGHEVSGFIKAEGKYVVNGDGRRFVLRGVGFGSWLLPEGYMWRMPEQGDRPRRIERMIKDLIGEERAEQFWHIYYERYITEADIRQIAAEGFNSVRVPINARFLIEDGMPARYNQLHLQLIDQVINWCRTHQLYVILDLHGAPGGQTGTNIDDSEFDRPDLFTSQWNKDLTIDIWRMLAKRYKDEWIVAGYDLLNEPLPDWFSAYYDQVMPLYRDIVKAIREVDSRHMIILEGVHWSTDWSIFDEMIDDNLMLQFHKYWNNPDTESIQLYLDKREEWNVPIFMGEGGENNKNWYTGAFRMFDDHDISWNFWTWKKMDTNNSPCSINKPTQWHLLVEYLEGGARPDVAKAEEILWEYLGSLPFDKCVYRPAVSHALLRTAPVRIPAIFYGYRGAGVSFGISERTDRNVGFRVNDGTDIGFIESSRTIANFQHGGGEEWQQDERLYIQLAAEDWLAYEFVVGYPAPSSLYYLDLRMCAAEVEGSISILLNGTTVGAVEMDGPSWNTIRLESKLILRPGQQHIVLKAEENPIRIEWLEVTVV
ncbi:MAG: cellulase family glycosylhydrolase [Paenibacillaceae bacterium]